MKYRLPLLYLGATVALWLIFALLTSQRTALATARQTLDLTPLANITQVAAGTYHTCALTDIGGVKCWGYNGEGELGDGTTTINPKAVAVLGLSNGVSSLVVGKLHTCVLINGGVKCWGNNTDGQLGDGTKTSSPTPVAVLGLASGVGGLTTGGYHTCAWLTSGGVKCWGNNTNGQLGDNTTTSSPAPVTVLGLSGNVSGLAAGSYHTCAMIAGGGVQCWGLNHVGQLGNNTTSDSPMPVNVVGISGTVSGLAANGNHSCAVISGAGVQCWGWNFYGQLGDDTTTDHSKATNVAEISGGVSGLTTGESFTCALISGSAQCWGRNDNGQLGDGTTIQHTKPMLVGLGSGVTGLSAGGSHTCAVVNGGVQCWGWNGYGQLGDGSLTQRPAPVAVLTLSSGVSGVIAGGHHTCAWLSSGVQCWGTNSGGQLGDGTTNDRTSPVTVNGVSSAVTSLAAGSYHTCALISGGVKCWGANYYGQLGSGLPDSSQAPVDVVGLSSGVSSLVSGAGHACALLSGGVHCWGLNATGQLGNDTTNNQPTPVTVVGLSSSVSGLAAGATHTCAVVNDGVQCWGNNNSGQLGDNTTTNRLTPVPVSGLSSGVTGLAAGLGHTCALVNAGVQCWGNNSNGQLGDNTTTNRLTPVPVSGLSSGVTGLIAGGSHTCALLTGGGMKCWGSNYYGQLGDGTTDSRATPVPVSGLSSGVSSLTAGDSHTCAVTSAGGVQCWGLNDSGQLGDGNAWRTMPAAVVEIGVTTPTATVSVTPVTTPTPTATPIPTPNGGDEYEVDDTCSQAPAITPNGAPQEHTFHAVNDTDWVQFAATAGESYQIEARAPAGSSADVVAEIYAVCAGATLGGQNYPFTPGVRLEFKAPTNGPLLLKFFNADPGTAGPAVRYELSVRALSAQPTANTALILVAGGIGVNDSVRPNIYHVTDEVYKVFLQNGYTDDRINYLAADASHTHVDDHATLATLQKAITEWAANQVDKDGALTIYLMDHGDVDTVYLDKPQQQWVTPAQLNEWLNQLEAARPGLKINVIIEACYAGSFISGPQTISKAGRVVIASTRDDFVAWASDAGAIFSDPFIAALNRRSSLDSSFQDGQAAAYAFHTAQVAWLDADGDTLPNEPNDRAIAAQRGFNVANSLTDHWSPYIAETFAPQQIENGNGVLTAIARDDKAVKYVWAVIYPPAYTPPGASEALVRDVDNAAITTIKLEDPDADGKYSATYTGFDAPGIYRVVIYAVDDEELTSQPTAFEVKAGGTIFLPLVRR